MRLEDQCLKLQYRIFVEINDENERQLEKWGVQTHSPAEWLMILMEELGELAKAIAENQYRDGTDQEVYKEAIQVTTLAMKIAEMYLDIICFKNGESLV